jgi:hypothetical protein
MDFHFLVRNGIAGGIFLIAFIVGMWVVSPAETLAVLKNAQSLQSLAVAGVAAGTPIIGICLQSLVLLYRYGSGGVFTDSARGLVARRYRGAILSNPDWHKAFYHLLDHRIDDRLFVSIYHRKAHQHLIEWARRRRSYSYLGETSATGAIFGTTFGILFSAVEHEDFWNLWPIRALTVAFCITLWTFIALRLAARMKQDADQMELAWVIYELAPDFEKAMAAPESDNALEHASLLRSLRGILMLVADQLFGKRTS